MAYVAQTLTQEPIYKLSSISCFKPILLSAHKLILLIYGDNTNHISLINNLTIMELIACSDGRVCILMLEACFTCISV